MSNLQTISQQQKAKRLSDNGIRKTPPSEKSAKLCKTLLFLQTFIAKSLSSSSYTLHPLGEALSLSLPQKTIHHAQYTTHQPRPSFSNFQFPFCISLFSSASIRVHPRQNNPINPAHQTRPLGSPAPDVPLPERNPKGGAGIKPRVERSGTLGNRNQTIETHEMGDGKRPGSCLKLLFPLRVLRDLRGEILLLSFTGKTVQMRTGTNCPNRKKISFLRKNYFPIIR